MPRPETAAARLLRSLSLDALRGFEAAARHLSFTAAAEELSLTQGAVSKQVKQLEEAIGRPVFSRGPRGLGLTPEGRRLHGAVRETLQGLEAALQQLVQADRRSVSVSAAPSFASLWLAPRLPAFCAAHPGIDVRIDASEANLVLEREGIDLALRLGRPGQVPAGWRLLMQEQLMLTAAPALARQVHEPADLLRLPLLVFHHPIERVEWMSWTHWYRHFGLARPPSQPVFQFSHYEHLVKAAAEGAGVAIGRVPQLLPLLRAGQLEVLLPAHRAEGLAYHLVLSDLATGREEVLAFARWVEQALVADAMG
jgi:DNA-binding transcriptional LysR family regulator